MRVYYALFHSAYFAGGGSAALVLTEEAEPAAGVTVAPDPAAEVGRDAPAKTFLTWTMASTKRISRRWVHFAAALHAIFTFNLLSCPM